MAINTFHGDPRPSLWRWRAPADSSHIERQIRSHPQTAKMNEYKLLYILEKLSALKLRSVVLHVMCTRAHTRNILVLAIETPTSRCAIRGPIWACVLAIGLGFCDTPRVLHSVLDLS